VIVRVTRGDELLLARSRRFPQPIYSVLAGFVEPGESLEDTVRREIAEEVGLVVSRIEYFGSQPWPFPHSLMIGFTAAYASGELRVDDDELLDAGWYTTHALPLLPPPYSIARRLIDDWIVTQRPPQAASRDRSAGAAGVTQRPPQAASRDRSAGAAGVTQRPPQAADRLGSLGDPDAGENRG
jgi:NADH pyrophosphatase NudC (nudix superfamily)